MNYNANTGQSSGPRKLHKKSDQQNVQYGGYGIDPNVNMYGMDPNMGMGTFNPAGTGFEMGPPAGGGYPPYGQPPSPMGQNQMTPNYQQMPQWSVPGLADPVASAAMQYGQVLVGQGKQAVEKEINRYLPIDKLKYYFAVDTSYVAKKLILLMFPFGHKDWSIKYESENQPVQPRYEVNAPDLYIPLMAYVTYVLVAGLVLGTQNRFAPEVLGIQASSALAWTILELVVVLISMYIINIQSQLRYLDLLAYVGYKFVGIIVVILMNLIFANTGYWLALIYCSIAIGFFLIRSLKSQLLPETSSATVDPYNVQNYQHVSASGTKRRLYILMVMSASQTLIMWRLSSHLI